MSDPNDPVDPRATTIPAPPGPAAPVLVGFKLGVPYYLDAYVPIGPPVMIDYDFDGFASEALDEDG